MCIKQDCMKKIYCFLLLWWVAMGFCGRAQSFVHKPSSTYEWPTDEKVVEHLRHWQDLKFGIILHWGLYSVPGIVESWQLTSEDWITPDPKRSYHEFKEWYWGLADEFNPTQFNPEQWATVAEDAGMKYMVFTTKHHDGFCLFDTKQTDFSVAHSAFAANLQFDVARHVFDAFRKKGMMIGCYFSKPDWHSDDYWWTARSTPNRLHNYDVKQYPERWERYKSFVYNQVDELMSSYGKVDILWLDGGWCTPPREDINLDAIVNNARSHQPGLIVVDRACAGKHENYQTPEQRIPDHQITTPWESCITLTHDWGWTDHPVYKSPAKIIATLVEVVAKGGSLLLGVGPNPQGIIEDGYVERLHQIGDWLRVNGRAIYNTVPTPVYNNLDGNVWFTADKDGHTLYAIIPPQEEPGDISSVSWLGNRPVRGSRVRVLSTGKSVSWNTNKDGITEVKFSKDLNVCRDGVVLAFTVQDISL